MGMRRRKRKWKNQLIKGESQTTAKRPQNNLQRERRQKNLNLLKSLNQLKKQKQARNLRQIKKAMPGRKMRQQLQKKLSKPRNPLPAKKLHQLQKLILQQRKQKSERREKGRE